MTTRLTILAAAVTIVLPLGAVPAFAQNTGNYGLGTTYREEHKGRGGEHSPRPHAAGQATAKKHTRAAAPQKYQEEPVADSTDMLNGASLSAAKQGQAYTPDVSSDPNMKKKM